MSNVVLEDGAMFCQTGKVFLLRKLKPRTAPSSYADLLSPAEAPCPPGRGSATAFRCPQGTERSETPAGVCSTDTFMSDG